MSVQKICALIVIFIGTSIAWVILGSANLARTSDASSSLKSSMQAMYGDELVIDAPTVYKEESIKRNLISDDENDVDIPTTKDVPRKVSGDYAYVYARLESSDIKMDVKLMILI